MKIDSEYIVTLQNLAGIGNKTILNIVKKLNCPICSNEDLYNFLSSLSGKKFEKITYKDICEANIIAKQIFNKSKENDIGILSYFDDLYPEILRHCKGEDGKLDPPIILYFRGNISILKKIGIAIIGTRGPTNNGILAGEYFSAELAKHNFNIVSGLAIGCDSAAHRGALSVNGSTTAFLANGLDWGSIYPQENVKLAQEIVEKDGLLLSEYPVGQSCGRFGLVARDRLQAGLSTATIVIQTGINGGTMHAVNASIASRKPLFAVEYRNPDDNKHEKVQGNIMLIRDKGAVPLRSNELESAFRIIENSYSPEIYNNLSEPSLFD